MLMDFGTLPPEVNSARIYAGPGSGPMLAAALAWDALASDLTFVADGYGSVILELSGSAWIGPASALMVTAVVPYVAWLNATAAQAETSGLQARAAAAAYEAAFAMTLPPPVIAANRALLLALVVTNLFGQNTAAIAAVEGQYAEMWAQDAAAMYTYAESSAIASVLTPFTPPPNIANQAGLAGRAAPRLSPTDWIAVLASLATAEGFIYDGAGFTLNIEQVAQMLIWAPTGAAAAAGEAAQTGFGTATVGPVLAPGAVIEVSATFGEAAQIGRMSAPPSWTPAPAQPAVETVEVSNSVARPGTASTTASLLRGLPTTGRGRTASFGQRRQGFSPVVVQRPVAAG